MPELKLGIPFRNFEALPLFVGQRPGSIRAESIEIAHRMRDVDYFVEPPKATVVLLPFLDAIPLPKMLGVVSVFNFDFVDLNLLGESEYLVKLLGLKYGSIGSADHIWLSSPQVHLEINLRMANYPWVYSLFLRSFHNG